MTEPTKPFTKEWITQHILPLDSENECLLVFNAYVERLLQSERAKVWEAAAKIAENHDEPAKGPDHHCCEDCPCGYWQEGCAAEIRARAREESKP